MASVDELRKRFSWAREKSDNEVVLEAARRSGEVPGVIAFDLGLDPSIFSHDPKRNPVSAGLSSGWQGLKGIAASSAAAGADAFGFEGARDDLNQYAADQNIRAQFAGRPDLERIEDQGIGSFFTEYAPYQISKQASLIAGAVGAAFTPMPFDDAAILGSIGRSLTTVPKSLAGGGLKAGAGFAERRAALEAGRGLASGVYRSAVGMYPIGVGSLYQESVKAGDPNAIGSLMGGALYGATEAFVPAWLRGTIGHSGGAFTGNFLKRAGKAGLLAAGGETATELTQNEMEMSFNPNLTPEEIASRRLNAAAAGSLVGGSIGTFGGIRRAPSASEQYDLLNARAEEATLARRAEEQAQFDQSFYDERMPTQAFVDATTGVNATRGGINKKNSMFAEGTGIFVVDPNTGIERELNTADWLQMQGQDYSTFDSSGTVRTPITDQMGNVVDTHTELDIPLPKTPGEAVSVIQLAHDENLHGRPVAEGHPLHTAMLAAQGVLQENNLTFRPEAALTSAAKPAAETKVASAPQVGQEWTPARNAFVKGGGSIKAWNQFMKKNHLQGSDPEVVARYLFEQTQNPAVSGKNIEPWIAAYEAMGIDVSQMEGEGAVAPTSQAAPITGKTQVSPTLRPGAEDSLPGEVRIITPEEYQNAQEVQGPVRQAGQQTVPVQQAFPAQAAGQQTAQEVGPQRAVTKVAKPGDLTKKQNDVFDLLMEAARNNELDKYIRADGVRQYEAIGKKLGIPRGSVKYAVDEAIKKFEEANGGTLRERLRQDTAVVRTTEEADQDRLGLSPAVQNTRHIEGTDLFGNAETGAEASMEMVDSAGKTNSNPFADSLGNEGGDEGTALLKEAGLMNRGAVQVQEAPDPVHEARKAAAEAHRQAAIDKVLRHPFAAEAARDWDDMSDGSLSSGELSREDAYDWILTFKEFKDGIISEEQLNAEQRLIERHYVGDADGGLPGERGAAQVGAEQGSGTGAVEAVENPPAQQTEKPRVTVKPKKKLAAPSAELTAEKPATKPQEKPATQSPAKPQEEELPSEVQLIGKLNALKKDKRHAAIASDYYNRAIRGDDVFEEAKAWVEAVTADTGAKFSMSRGTTGGTSTTKAEVEATVEALTGKKTHWKVRVFNTVEEATASGELNSKDADGVKAWVRKGRAYFILDRIKRGTELSVFLHEIGAHLGLENILSPKQFDALYRKIEEWYLAGSGVEGKIAAAAWDRMRKAGLLDDTDALTEGTTNLLARQEALAYFIEEAVKAGVDPTAVSYANDLTRWFRTLWAAFKVALRRLGLVPENLTAQNVVDLAYGAARLELTGAWHGTAGEFRRFDHKFMGAGEGAQAFGWGTYLAQRGGIAREYWKADTRRKQYEMEGSLMRVDMNARDDELLDWDRPLSGQSKLVRKALDNVVIHGNKINFDRAINEGWTGGRLYRFVQDRFAGGVTWQNRDASAKAASEYLDSIGIKGIKFLDAKSRSRARVLVDRNGNEVVIDPNAHTDVSHFLIRADGDYAIAHDLVAESPVLGQKMKKRHAKLLDEYQQLGYTVEDNPKATRNLVIFNDKNVYRVYSERGARTDDKRFSMNDRAHITDAGLIDILAKIEGEAWAREQRAGKFEKYGVPAIQKNYQEIKEYGEEYGVNDLDNRVIYGSGGYNRYNLAEDGSVVPIPESFSNAEKLAQAKELLGDSRKYSKEFSERGREWSNNIANKLDTSNTAHRLLPMMMTLHQLKEVYGKVMATLNRHVELTDRMAMAQQRHMRDGHRVTQKWVALHKATMHRLNKVMLDATMQGIHPDLPFEHKDNAHLGKGSEARAAYEALKARYNALPKDAKEVYQEAKAHLASTWEARRVLFGDVTRAAYKKRIDEAMAAKDTGRAGRLARERDRIISKHDEGVKSIVGPYFPLVRFGDYVVVYQSETYEEMDKAGDQEGLAKLRKNPAHYSVKAFESLREAEQYAARKPGSLAPFKAQEFDGQFVAAAKAGLEHIAEAISHGLDAASARKVKDLATRLYISSLPEHSALTRQLKREGIEGASDDMLRAFGEVVEKDSFFLSRMQYGKDITDNMFEMKSEARNGGPKHQHVYDNLVQRIKIDLDYKRTPVQDVLTKVSGFFHLGMAPAFLLTNLTQPWMIAVPQLAGTYGMARTFGAMRTAFGDAARIIKTGKGGVLNLNDADFAKLGDGTEAQMLRYIADLGQLDITQNADMGLLAEGMNPKFYKAMKAFNWATHHIEMHNRVTTALAAYRLVKARTPGIAEEDARKVALDAVVKTQLDYTGTNAAYFMKQGVGPLGGMHKVVYQFRKYQQGMVYLLARNARLWAQGDKESMRSLMYLMGMQTLFAGAAGIPAVMPALFVAGLFIDDDDEEGDAETQFRNYVADSIGADAARAFWSGLPSAIGLNVSKNIGMGDLLSPTPMLRTSDVTDAKTGKGAIGAVAAEITGGTGGVLAAFMDAYLQDDITKAFPRLLRNPAKALKYADEGLSTRSGTPVFEAGEFDGWDLVYRALGFSTTKEAEHYAAQAAKSGVARAMSDRKSELLREFAKARIQGKGSEDAEEAIREYNGDHRAVGSHAVRCSKPCSSARRMPRPWMMLG